MGNYIHSRHNNKELPITNKLKWQFIISSSTSIQGIFQHLENPQYATLLTVLNQIPANFFVRWIEGSTMDYFNRNPSRNYNLGIGEKRFKQFNQILYPTEIPPQSGKQIEAIQNFVINGVRSGKRIRGTGIRHSWGNIFADNQQLLVSFYPYSVVIGNSRQLREYANKMNKIQQSLALDGIEHLCMIRDFQKSLRVLENKKEVIKHLVKVGAGVSNEQLRMWCINNGFQYKSNVIMIKVSVCGGLGTCSHRAGVSTQTIADYVYQIEFIDFNGKRQTISKEESLYLYLIKSAASAMGLLELVIFITLQMEKLQIVKFLPRTSYKDFIILWLKDYPKEKQDARLQRQERKAWKVIQQQEADDDWQINFQMFKKAVNESYCKWFYFLYGEVRAFENVWSIFWQRDPQNLLKIKKENQRGKFIDIYPAPTPLQQSNSYVSQFINHELKQDLRNIFARAPFAFFPQRDTYVNYPDAVYYQRGIHNIKARSLEFLINIPALEGSHGKEPDYNLIQKIWWTAFEMVEDSKEMVNTTLEMRVLKGSEATGMELLFY